jgi:predicted DNA-binding transcriptional regulator YafY
MQNMPKRKNATAPKHGTVIKKKLLLQNFFMATTERIERISFIIRTVQRYQPIKLRELQDKLQESNFSYSKNTIQRDFDKIMKMGYNLKFDHKNRTGYSIDSDRFHTAYIDRFMEEYELYMALESVKGFSAFIFPEPRRPQNIENLRPFIDAIRNSQYVQFHYHKLSNRNAGFLITDPKHSAHVFESLGGNTESFRIVAPYILKEFRGLWYLIGEDDGEDDKDNRIKIFALDRVSDVKNVERRYDKDDSFNVSKKFHNCFGIYTPRKDSKAEVVILSFDAENGRYLKANPLHYSQKILIDNENEFRISLYLYITLDFLQEILTRSWSLKIIEPESRCEKVCEIWKRAIGRNEL